MLIQDRILKVSFDEKGTSSPSFIGTIVQQNNEVNVIECYVPIKNATAETDLSSLKCVLYCTLPNSEIIMTPNVDSEILTYDSESGKCKCSFRLGNGITKYKGSIMFSLSISEDTGEDGEDDDGDEYDIYAIDNLKSFYALVEESSHTDIEKCDNFEDVYTMFAYKIGDVEAKYDDLVLDLANETISTNSANYTTLEELVNGYVNDVYTSYETSMNNEWATYKTSVDSDIATFKASVNSQLSGLASGEPKVFETSTIILAKTSNEGIALGTDDGHKYYWNGTNYVDGGVYQATEIADESIKYNHLDVSLKNCFNTGNNTINLLSYNDSDAVNYSVLNASYGWVIQKVINKGATINLKVHVEYDGIIHLGSYNISSGKIENKKIVSVTTGEQTIDVSDFVFNDDSYLVVKSLSKSLSYKADSTGVTTFKIDGADFENGSSPTLTNVSSPFLWAIELNITNDFYCKLKITHPIVIVDKNNNGDYSNISDAINNTNDGDTIFICPGIYEEQINMNGKNRVLIGSSKDNTYIISENRLYNYEPIKANMGSISNLTIIGGYGLTPIENDKRSTSYAIHIECANTDDYQLIIDNCNIISNVAPAIGMGVRYNQKVIIKNCLLETKASVMWSSVYSEYFNIGGIFVHNDASGSNLGTNGYLSIENCEIKGIITGITLQSQNNGNTLTLRMLKNTVYSYNNGKENAITKRNSTTGENCLCGNDIKLDNISFGNNILELNN